jgi:hypothetical protein
MVQLSKSLHPTAHSYITLESKKCPVMYNHEPTYKLNELTTKVVN